MDKLPLTANELGMLWTQYVQNSMVDQILRYFLETVENEKTKSVIKETLAISIDTAKESKRLLVEDGAPAPKGFNEQDVDLNSPKLFTDSFMLTFIEHIGKAGVATNGLSLGFSVRKDVRDFLSETTRKTIDLFNHCIDTSLSEDVYIRAPQVDVQSEAEYVQGKKYLSPFKKRSLNTVEISHLFENVKTNVIGEKLCTGFAQTTKSPEIKSYLKKGKKISKKHLNTFTNTLKESDIYPPMSPSSMVSTSTTPVFSNRLIISLMTMLSSAGQANYSAGSSASFRYDIIFNYQRLSAEISLFAKDGLDLMIKNGWLEEPSQAPDRSDLIK